MKEKIAYRCDHCKKVYLSRSSCERHESSMCRQNPSLKAKCFYGCKHLISKDATVTVDTFGGDVDIKVSLLWCEKKQSHVVPFWAVRKDKWYDVAYIDGKEIDSLFAPMDCEQFEINKII